MGTGAVGALACLVALLLSRSAGVSFYVENDGEGASQPLVECDLNLKYNASRLNEETFDAAFTIRNNSPDEIPTWEVEWTYEAEDVMEPSLKGARLVYSNTTRQAHDFLVTSQDNSVIPTFST